MRTVCLRTNGNRRAVHVAVGGIAVSGHMVSVFCRDLANTFEVENRMLAGNRLDVEATDVE